MYFLTYTATRKGAYIAAAIIVSLVVLSVLDNYLAVRLDLSIYDNGLGSALFILTVVLGYGVGSWFLLGYVKLITTKLRAKYSFINIMYVCVTIIQFSLLAMFILLIYNRNELLLHLVFLISSVSAVLILGFLGFKFFTWYKTSNKNHILLYFGLAASTLGAAILANVGTHSFLVKVVQQVRNSKTIFLPPPPKTSGMMDFVKPYVCDNRDCIHQIQGSMRMMKDIRNHTTIFYVVPSSDIFFRNYLNVVPYTLAQIFRWVCVVALLLQYYPRLNRRKFWILISIPLIFFIAGKTPLLLGINPSPYWQALANTGTLAISIIFGILVFTIARKILAVRDYVIIAAIGIILAPISLSTSILQETFGVAAHSLVMLSSYLFCVGFYSLAISISQDSSLRVSIRKSMVDILDKIGAAQMEQDLQKRVVKLIKDKEQYLEEETGIPSSLTEDDIHSYMKEVSEEVMKTRKTARK